MNHTVLDLCINVDKLDWKSAAHLLKNASNRPVRSLGVRMDILLSVLGFVILISSLIDISDRLNVM